MLELGSRRGRIRSRRVRIRELVCGRIKEQRVDIMA